EIIDRAGIGRKNFRTALARLKGLPRTSWSTAIAHFGVGVTVLGVVCATAFEVEIVTSMQRGDSVEIGGYTVTYNGEQAIEGPNYLADQGQFSILSPWDGQRSVTSERRVYAVSQTPTTEAGIT